ncbi:hypothetical protein OQA88_12648 [Cercophora sp. LCS_1]
MDDNEIARLRQALAEQQRLHKVTERRALDEQRRREAAERRALDEQHQREEEQRRCKDERRRRKDEQRRCKDERRQRKDERRQHKDERRRREAAECRALDEQHQREEEQRRREKAEEAAKTSQPQTLASYLEACNALSLAIEVVTDRFLTTQGNTTNPTGRIYPRRIIPWDDFPARQQKIWDQLSEPSFTSRLAFPSQNQMDFARSLISPISSEQGLRHFEHTTVESAVEKMVSSLYENPLLRDRLGLRGVVKFESHTNLGNTSNSKAGTAGGATPKPTAKGKGNLADNFCIYRTSDNGGTPTMAIEYKAPHKLSREEVTTGLESEIQPDRDVINKDGEGFAFAAKALAAAVVTQLFSYMIGKRIQ